MTELLPEHQHRDVGDETDHQHTLTPEAKKLLQRRNKRRGPFASKVMVFSDDEDDSNAGYADGAGPTV
jgi:hypothetical protein